MGAKIIKKWMGKIISFLLILLFVIILFLVISSKVAGGEPQVFGYQLKTVLSGSMEPGIKTGSVIVVKTGGDLTKLKVNDVITFNSEGNKTITHRIKKMITKGEQVLYRTKGDNNKTEDSQPVMAENVVAKYTGFTVPYLGYINDFAKSKNGNLVLMVLPGLLFLAYSIYTIWKVITQLDLKKLRKEMDETI